VDCVIIQFLFYLKGWKENNRRFIIEKTGAEYPEKKYAKTLKKFRFTKKSIILLYSYSFRLICRKITIPGIAIRGAVVIPALLVVGTGVTGIVVEGFLFWSTAEIFCL